MGWFIYRISGSEIYNNEIENLIDSISIIHFNNHFYKTDMEIEAAYECLILSALIIETKKILTDKLFSNA